ncbi:immunoglobulin lambda-1 light chain-like isoform X14 [Anguilla anguilla]|uniref:immunoglobulin lambda-1 light chain-like isoform X14 n=1 Tax=Anguilla anguilla TaxID=7936 RepID=UPI0015ADEFD0|nr:immunoglobulin lambda-1 light chain-like isoform X14 [Anguilla anguilla]
MLGTLCTLIAVLSCVGGQTLLTQKPSMLSLTKGQTATMDCNIGPEDTYNIYWYKQVPGSAPQFLLYFYHSHKSPTYGAGFSSSRFTSTAQGKTDYQLIISNVEAGDSAVYYCQKWVNSVSERVFGQGTKLIVADSSLAAPTLSVLPPSSEELKTDKATLVCLAQMSVGFADVSWTSGGTPVTGGVFTSAAEQKPDKTFGLSSFLTIKPSEWITDRVFTCKVSVGSKTSEKSIKKSDCSE